jgi:ABC-type multidrug transport system fused ATPase/permease subunit
MQKDEISEDYEIDPRIKKKVSLKEKLKNVFKKKKKEIDVNMIDPVEVKVYLWDFLRIYFMIGIDFIIIFFGCLAAILSSATPMLFYYILGSLIGYFLFLKIQDTLSGTNGKPPNLDQIGDQINILGGYLLLIAIGNGVFQTVLNFCNSLMEDRISVKLK